MLEKYVKLKIYSNTSQITIENPYIERQMRTLQSIIETFY